MADRIAARSAASHLVDIEHDALLRREGLYSSHLVEWRRLREKGELAGLTPKKRGRKVAKTPLADENEKLKRELERMKRERGRGARSGFAAWHAATR